ncbi:MAG: biopolymer transporter ExbD [Deltaproteobacteria bacterium]|nr:biopolymer transporter ExbD [Deltaproteobacteria bacterium]MBW1958076.1 biopolymer transporter ExbD [Deltaproteobacteria bacterium]MBW2014768.1 biopolymer transporter ExbD [Deltaproteobacteria bacterium]MBW2087976.1 biopolymer transporter ExbD [Deltaproteobacteria bacterium]MBW2321470.1 biopolymer transporter ExbD [Deltaproteobacteria bacterium]
MKVDFQTGKKVRIEMLPLIDIVFLLLVFFIYAMLSMAVHRGLPILLPTSSSAKIDKSLVLSVTIKSDGTLYVDKEQVALNDLAAVLKRKTQAFKEPGVLLFAERSLSYQSLFRVLDQIRMADIHRISLQADVEQ